MKLIVIGEKYIIVIVLIALLVAMYLYFEANTLLAEAVRLHNTECTQWTNLIG